MGNSFTVRKSSYTFSKYGQPNKTYFYAFNKLLRPSSVVKFPQSLKELKMRA